MSLTSHLAARGSPVREYIEFYATAVAEAKRGAFAGTELQRLLSLDQLPPRAPAIRSEAEPRLRGTVGSAFDYRVRMYFPDPGDFHAARLGAMWVPEVRLNRFDWFMENLTELLNATEGRRGSLDDDEETLLCKYCTVLAEFEAAYRSAFYAPRVPPNRRKSQSTPDDDPLLKMADSDVVSDVKALSRSVPGSLGPLIDAAEKGVPFKANPTFDGSRDVGGADADFVIGDTIFEIKAGSTLDVGEVRRALLQLAGYALLDYSDEFEIRHVGVYFARHRWVASWPLWRLVFPVADIVRYGAEGEPSEADVGKRLAIGRRGLREAAAGCTMAAPEQS